MHVYQITRYHIQEDCAQCARSTESMKYKLMESNTVLINFNKIQQRFNKILTAFLEQWTENYKVQQLRN
jgi:hypothetical protein